MNSGPQQISTLRDQLHVVRRRKWIILQAVVVVPVAAVLLSLRQTPLYQASAEVLLSHQNLATSLTNTQDPTIYQQADRIAQTQADLARVPRVAENVRKALDLSDRTAADILAASSVAVKQNADLLVFQVRDRDRGLAARIAAEYASQFASYRRKLDTAALERARREVEDRVDALRAAGDHSSALYAGLVTKEQQLRTMEALQTSNAFVVRSPKHASKVRPQPVRMGILGFGIGLLFGLCLAFLWEALDTRVRSAKEIGDRLGLPLLARVPEPPRKLRRNDQLVMADEPNSVHGEAYRLLRTNFEFQNLERRARVVMVTSAVEAEGKSTTAANLALALARAGKRVALVDLDLRRPYIERFFDLGERPGVTDVALGHISLDGALAPVPVGERKENEPLAESGPRAERGPRGLLEVLPAGATPPDTGEFVATQTLSDIVAELRERFDVVLVDAPPLLNVGDALTLSAKVDALLIVSRLNVVRHPLLEELRRVLEACPRRALGYVAAGVEADDEYSSYARYYYRERGDRRPRTGVR